MQASGLPPREPKDKVWIVLLKMIIAVILFELLLNIFRK